jgi:protein-disulfide isomerase
VNPEVTGTGVVNGTPTFSLNDVRRDDSYDADTLLGALEGAERS